MTDIKQFILHGGEGDPHGYLADLDAWSEHSAKQAARDEGIDLISTHWNLIYMLRNHWRNQGPSHNARDILRLLESGIYSENPRKELYRLFPGGPVRQACKLAGLPTPGNSSDPSFGSVH